jgi:hypothetical protein
MSDWRPTPEQLEAITGASTLDLVPPILSVYGMSDPDYRRVGAVNNSFLKLMDPMPGSAIGFFTGGDKPQFRIGRYVHQGVLTPHDPVPKFVVYPEVCADGAPWNMARNECQLWAAKKRAAGFEVFTQPEYNQWSGCIRSLCANSEVQTYLSDGQPEVSCVAVIEIDGVRFRIKTRIDWVPAGTALLNFKTTIKGGSSALKFGKEVRNGYGFQAAVELMVWNLCNPRDIRETYVWPVVEKEPPYCLAFFYATWDALFPYRDALQKRLSVFAKCIRDGVFPGDDPIYHAI